jgi:hypothetical protein
MWKYASEDYALLSLAILLLHLRGLCELSGTLRDRFRQYLEGWVVERDLWLPSVAAVGMYLLVHIETRFLGGFAVLFTIGSLGSLRTARPALASSRKTDFLAAGLVAILCGAMVLDAAHASRTIVWGEPPGNHPCWEAATALREEHGLAPGSKLAVIGDAFHCGWARLGRYRIVAQIEPQHAERFHNADAAGQQAVLQALRRTGVQAVVAEEAAELSSQWFASPWLPIRGSRPGLHLQIEDSGALDE